MGTDDGVRISIRFPSDVLLGMRQLAPLHERSFNGEVVWALRRYVRAERKRLGLPTGQGDSDEHDVVP
jgi:hypothetical protein